MSRPLVFNMSQIAHEYGISKSLVHKWIKASDLEPDFEMPTGVAVFTEANVRANVPVLKASHQTTRPRAKR